MQVITNEKLLESIGGGEDMDTVVIESERMTDDEKHDYDKRAIWDANGYGGGV